MSVIRKTILYMQFYMVCFPCIYVSNIEHILQPTRAYYDIIFLIAILREHLAAKETKDTK